LSNGDLVTGEAILLTCEANATIYYVDDIIDNGDCADPRALINRRWTVVDASGNSVSCDQLITVMAFDPLNVQFPTDIDILNALSCSDVEENPEITLPEFTGIPLLGGASIFGDGYCDITVGYWDEILQDVNCPAGYSILRHWLVENDCLPIIADVNPIRHIQRIRIDDNTPPVLYTLEDVTVSVDPWSCTGAIELPEVAHDDDCSEIEVTWSVPYGLVQGNVLSNLLIGETVVRGRVVDGCGNSTSTTFTVTVIDATPPVVVALQNIVVSLSSTEGDGIAKVFVESIDNGSYDGCTDVKLEVRRDSDACDISGNDTYNDDGHSFDGSSNPNSPNYDPDGGAYIKFCCADLYDATVDIDEDGELDAGYVKVWLRVWDDGDNDGVFGSDGDNMNEAWAYVKVEDKLAPQLTCPADVTIDCSDDYLDLSVVGAATGFGSCGTAEVEYVDIIVNLTDCGTGFVRRRWTIVGRTDIFCDQTITVEGIEGAPVSVSFAQVGDFTADGCPDDIALGEPTWIGGACDVIGYTVKTDTFLFEDGACYKLVNNYSVINWCDYDPNNPLWDGEGLWEHTQVVKVTDNTIPELEVCEDQMFEVNDHADSDNDGIVCEAKVVLTNVAIDAGSENCPTGWLKWQVVVDLWGDGTEDLEYSSFLPPFDSNFNDTNGNNIPDVYLAPTANGETVSVSLPDIEGSMTNHKVTWKVTDGCNNVKSCSYNFMVVDKKAPTPYCIDISSAVMESDGTVELWAIDFNIGSFDNCTEQDDLRYTFTDVAPEDDSSYDPAQRSSAMTFDCDDVDNSPVEVSMYVWDEKGNRDFCRVFLSLVDNTGACGPGARISGVVSTESGSTLEAAQVTLNADLPEYPRTGETREDGVYAFTGTAMNAEYQVTVNNDIDYLNGVTTLDLVMIQRHLLELQLLDSPYKVLASDINGDESLNVSDISELRKLILGVITELPNNDSWRFVNNDQTFSDIYNPWPLDESIVIENLQGDMDDNDFVAVKIGDVSGNATTNLVDINSEVRSANAIELFIDNKTVQAGEYVEVTFESDNYQNVYGYQFTMELDGLTFSEVVNSTVGMGEQNVGQLGSEVITVSYNSQEPQSIAAGDGIFTIGFVATKSGSVSEMIRMSDKVTPTESYVASQGIQIYNLTLDTRSSVAMSAENVLYQNEPNPFREMTTVRYELAEAGAVTMTVTDAVGRVLKVINTEGTVGMNTVAMNSEDFGVTGVLYCKLESGEFASTIKMIAVR